MLGQAAVWERFIWDLHHELARVVCGPIPVDSALCRCYKLYRERIEAENDIETRVERIGSFIENMIEALNDLSLAGYLPDGYAEYAKLQAEEWENFRQELAQVRQYSSRIPRITPSKEGMAVFMSLKNRIPSGSRAFTNLAAYLKLKDWPMDESALTAAEESRRIFTEERQLANQRFSEELNPVVLRAVLNDAGINPAGAN